jgi:hypothetical protein
MKLTFAVLGIILLIALALGTGCTSSKNTAATPAATPATLPPTTQQTAAPTTQPTILSLSPGPTDTIESIRDVDVSVEKGGTYSTTIIGKFDGGKGLMACKKVEVKVTTPEGQVRTCTIQNPKGGVAIGDTCEAEGSIGTDRVEVYVYMNDGKVYKKIDQLMPYKARG